MHLVGSQRLFIVYCNNYKHLKSKEDSMKGFNTIHETQLSTTLYFARPVAACGKIIGSTAVGECFLYQGSSERCWRNGEVLNYLSFDFHGQVGMIFFAMHICLHRIKNFV